MGSGSRQTTGYKTKHGNVKQNCSYQQCRVWLNIERGIGGSEKDSKNVLEINSNKINKTTRALLGNETILHVLERMDALPWHLVERGSPKK